MNDEDVDVVHATKRRKLEDVSPTLQSATRVIDYIVLATQRYTVNVNDTQVYKSLLKPDCDGLVEITNAAQNAHHRSFQVRIPWLKLTSEVTTSSDSAVSAQSLDPGLVQDCLKLPSSIKKVKSTHDRPICMYEACLSLQDQRPTLEIHLLWHDSPYSHEKVDDQHRLLLDRYASLLAHRSTSFAEELIPWTVKEFYDNVHVPLPQQTEQLRLDMVQCKLYPFQDRATRWMLAREGVYALPSGQLAPIITHIDKLPLDFRKTTDALGHTYYISRSLCVASTSRFEVEQKYASVKGGILAEAMGLGKTVEMIALMCSHKRMGSPVQTSTSDGLRETGATLIITPPTILGQWRQELAEHAPGLQVYHYAGMKGKGQARKMADILETLSQQDVVLTTYNVIASEIHYVKERPDRNLRDRPRREPPKSPLTQISWWRCLLDEAQMVESGVSNAAVVARLIPRVNAWAVTGTPLKQSHRDLYGLLLFLKYEPWCQSTRKWDHLVLYHRDLFRNLMAEVALRHSKELVRDELRIPHQSRQVASLPFTAIEESHYTQLHHAMQQECGFDVRGAPLEEDWDPNDATTIDKMRGWLQRLRQTCMHPEVGGRNRKALGRRGGPLRTVAQVLEVMIDQIDSVVHTEERALIILKVTRAQIFEHARQSQTAQDLFNAAYTEISVVVVDARKAVENELASSVGRNVQSVQERNDAAGEEEEQNVSLLTARQRLRSALEIQHICIFFIGNTYFQLKAEQEAALLPSPSQPSGMVEDVIGVLDSTMTEPSAKVEQPSSTSEAEIRMKAAVTRFEGLEAKAYEEAKAIRTELLMDVYSKAQKRIDSIHEKKELNKFAVMPQLDYSMDDFGGIESRKVFDKLYSYCAAMNAQAEQSRVVRDRMVNLLDRTLVDKEDGLELTGDEYEDSTKLQDEMYVLMELLRALFADRSDAISGQENLLTRQETKTFLRQAKEGGGPAPELMIQLLGERETKRIVPSRDGSLRGIVTEIRSLATSLEWQESVSERAKAELAIVNRLLEYVQKMLAAQSKSISALEQESSLFKDAMNARLEYYRALQKISDTVAPVGEEEDVGKPVSQAHIDRILADEETASKKLSVALSKRRYLLHLKNESETEGEAKICTICQFEFENGTLTVCGHQFCKECIQIWYTAHRNCPVCKRRLTLNDFHDITYKPQAPKDEPESGVKLSSERPSGDTEPADSNSIYTTIPTSTLNQIRTIEIRGSSYGSKVDTLIRHVLYLRIRDPGSKSIVFSQYRDFLEVLSRSLRENNIPHSKFDDKDGILEFKSNPANECFLLHAKAHAAGLNLVCANHVILCEPLINTAIELQAVARVHRIGQQRATTVWMYLIEGTVEEAIYDISVERRLAHMDGKSREVSRATSRAVTPHEADRSEAVIEAANTKELQAADLSKMFAKGNTGGEMVDKEDLWGCLFGSVVRKLDGERGVRKGLADLEAGSVAVRDTGEVGAEIGRFLRAEAAEARGG